MSQSELKRGKVGVRSMLYATFIALLVPAGFVAAADDGSNQPGYRIPPKAIALIGQEPTFRFRLTAVRQFSGRGIVTVARFPDRLTVAESSPASGLLLRIQLKSAAEIRGCPFRASMVSPGFRPA